MSQQPTLEYGRTKRVGKKTILWMSLAVIGTILTIAFAPFARKSFSHWIVIRRYHAAELKVLHHTSPSDLIVYSDDPAFLSAHAGQREYEPGIPEFDNLPPALVRVDSDIREFSRAADRAFDGMWIETLGQGTVFLHESKSPAGHDRIVYISVRDDAILAIHLYTPGLGSGPPGMTLLAGESGLVRKDKSHPITIYAGEADPADASHFTFAFDYRGKRYKVDGYLLDNDTVALNPELGTPRANGPYTFFDIDR